ncbi:MULTISPECIES: DUF4112 domain-containing protein [unclassified Methylobacterium]|uniref:DUF4112 domain-containing protein n=1 Tax=unclassified Methylobacterium TaxID=2615210 RepID=UPI001FCE2073|nr:MULTISPECIES: DUF4112 domain-containing protein [unclassified Methylobacterium]
METLDPTAADRFAGAARTGEADRRAAAEAAMLRLEQFAHVMDAAFVIPGINRRVGVDAVLGLVPGLGDLAGVCLSSYVVYEARRLGAPRWLLARMAMNVAFDGAVGIVPLAGDIFDAAFKANLRNVRLLRRHLERSGKIRPSVIEGTAYRIDG